MSLRERILSFPLAYRLWQAPFIEQKLRPLYAHNDMSRVRRVLDVACGPGTNTGHFAHSDYLGIDLNPEYVAAARRRHGRAFQVADLTTYQASTEARFDCVFVNSFFHHVADVKARRILAHLAELVADQGFVHILDLVLPERWGVPRLLVKLDRGEHARPLDAWRELFCSVFDEIVFEPYEVGAFGATLWRMVYFKGRPATVSRKA